MQNLMKPFLLSFICCLLTLHLQATDSLRIQYTGNMGVLISGRSTAISVDGLHKRYKPAYQHPPEDLVRQIISNKEHPPIRILLNTHIHQDHFDAGLVRTFLKQNPKAILIGPPQTGEEIASVNGVEQLSNRVRVVPLQNNKLTTFNSGDVQVDGFFLQHVNPARHSAIKNIGYLITIDDKIVLHAGDTDWNGEVFKALALHERQIDVAILPNWMVMTADGAEIVKTHLQPKQIIVAHISPFSKQEVKEEVQKYFPDAILFTEIGEEVMLSKEQTRDSSE